MIDIIPFLALLVMGIVMSQLFTRRIEETMPCAILAIVSVLFVTGVFGSLTLGLYLLAALTLGGLAIAVLRRQWRMDLVVTPGGLFLLLLLLFAMFYHRYRVVTDWDELGQWALSPKNMYLINQIPTPANSNIIYEDYPPASALWGYFWTKLTGTFQDSSLYVAMMFFNLGILAPSLKRYGWKDWKRFVPAYLMLLIAPRAFNNIAWRMLMIDYLLGALAVYCFYVYYTSKNTFFDWLQIMLALFVVIQVKSTGVVFAGVTVAYIAWDLCKTEKQIPKKVLLLIGLGIVVGCSKWLWNYFVDVHEMGTMWNMGELSLSRLNVFSTTNGVEGWRRTAFANCFRAILDYNISTRAIFYVRNTMVPLVIWFIIVAVLSWIVFVQYKKETRMFRSYVVWILANVIFTVSVAYLYYLSMSETECTVLAAYGRYMSTMISAIWMFGVVMLVHKLSEVHWNVVCAVGALLILLLPSWSLQELGLSKEANAQRIQQYEARQELVKEAQLLEEHVANESTIVFNGQTYVFNYLLAPVRFRGPLGLTVFTDLSSFLNFVPYNNRVYFSAYYGDIYTEQFAQDNAGHFWVEGADVTQVVKPYTLYRVLYDANQKIVLEYIGQIKK